eukprot:TRINITY_DN81778_c0_g1_i1.p1 TRINITY_DN81778_c0_g1~~TRINITY_DN81778_c0_g1_i1.p1  ORF type:complete len:215 (-),score=44.45 TRINITY_DN81778_c0_g1_i1:474-1118(-)
MEEGRPLGIDDQPLLLEIQRPSTSLWRRAMVAQQVGSAVALVAACLFAVAVLQQDQPDRPSQATSLSEVSDLHGPGENELVYVLSADSSFVVPQTCLTAMLLGACLSCCCCGVTCCEGEGCGEGCCRAFCSTISSSLGLAMNGVPVWSLATMWQATVAQAGGWGSLVKAFLASGFGFLGGVALTGSAAAAGLEFCRRYDDACGGCVGNLPSKVN